MSSSPDTSSPYVGLRPFFGPDSLYFFGRREQTGDLLERLHDVRFLGVVGSSGCGKSSMIRAGLIPALLGGFLVAERDKWRIGAMKPGDAPLRNLAAAICQGKAQGEEVDAEAVDSLRAEIVEKHTDAVIEYLAPQLGDDTNQLLLIDQFEEIFSFRQLGAKESLSKEARLRRAQQRAEAADLVDLIISLSERADLPIYTVLTMRTDFLGDCDIFYGLPEAMNRGRYLVPRLTRQQLKEAIVGPALLRGAEVAPRLLDHLLNELGDRSDRLPVLQHALLRTWDYWQGAGADGPIDMEHYEGGGTLENALSQHAEEALRDEDLEATSRVFRCLTETDENRRRIRRPSNLSELQAVSGLEAEEVKALLQRFIDGGRHFVVTSEGADRTDPRVDISHESLIRRWSRLGDWVDEEFDSSARFNELARDAHREAGGREDLLTGSALRYALDWRDAEHPTAEWAERYSRKDEDFELVMSFLDRSRSAEEEEARRRRRRRNILGSAAAIAFLVVSSLTLWALREKAKGRDIARVATADALMSTDPTRAALVLLEVGDPDREWHGWSPTQKMVEALGHGFFDQEIVAHSGAIRTLVFDPRGRFLVTASDDGGVSVVDVRSGEVLESFSHASGVSSAALSPSGEQLLAVSGAEGQLWDLGGAFEDPESSWEPTSAVDLGLLEHAEDITHAEFSPGGGARILTSSKDSTARLWSVSNGTSFVELAGHTESVGHAAFNFDGSRVVTVSDDTTARVWRTEPGVAPEVIATMEGHEAEVRHAAFSPGGSRVVTASRDATARIWWADGAGELATLAGHSKTVRFVRFNREGDRVLTVSRDDTARVWSASGPDEGLVEEALFTFRGHDGPLLTGSFNAAGDRVVTASEDGSAQVWATDGSDQYGPLVLLKSGMVSAAFSPDGERVATASEDGKIHLWSTRMSSSSHELVAPTGFAQAVALDPQGEVVATALRDGTARLWPLDGSTPIRAFQGDDRALSWVEFSPDGSTVVLASVDGTLRLWDRNGSGAPRVLSGHSSNVGSARFSADGSKLVTASIDRTARVWDLAADSTESTVLRGHRAPVRYAEFSPSGDRVVTASFDGTARVWSLEGDNESIRINTSDQRVERAIFSPSGSSVATAASAGSEGRVALWDAATGDPIGEMEEAVSEVVGLGFSADGNALLAISASGAVAVWDTETRALSASHQASRGGLTAGAFLERPAVGPNSPNKSSTRLLLATVSRGGIAVVEDLESASASAVALAGPVGRVLAAEFSADGSQVLTYTPYGPRTWSFDSESSDLSLNRQALIDEGGPVVGASFSPLATHVAALRDDGTLVLRSTADPAEELASFAREGSVGEPEAEQDSRSLRRRRVVFDESGQRVAVISDDHSVTVREVGASKSALQLAGHGRQVNNAAFDADGGRLVTSSDDGTARIWDLASGDAMVLDGHTSRVEYAVFSPDGRFVATASEDHTARIWDAATREPVGDPIAHAAGVELVAFSPDGELVLTASEDNTARVWAVDRERGESKPLQGHQRAVVFAAFSPDGRRVLTGSKDRTARVWKIDRSSNSLELSKEDPVELKGHREAVTSGSFSSDGQRVITVSSDGTARVWELAGERLQASIQRTLGYCLEPDFREQSLGESPAIAVSEYAKCRDRLESRSGNADEK